jgi:hypothetical protein
MRFASVLTTDRCARIFCGVEDGRIMKQLALALLILIGIQAGLAAAVVLVAPATAEPCCNPPNKPP